MKFINTYVVTAEQTENFFNILIEIIKYIFIIIPSILLIIGIIYLIKLIVAEIQINIKDKKLKQKQSNQIETNKNEPNLIINKEEQKINNQQIYIKQREYSNNINKNIYDLDKIFYNKQIEKLTKTEKLYYDILYKNFKDEYRIETQVYLRSMYPRKNAPNLKIDIVFKDKKWELPILLIEINDETHNRRKLTKLRDKDLKQFCQEHNIKLQALWTRYDINERSICKLIKKRLEE